jgi:histidinol-phosphate aminotransferase
VREQRGESKDAVPLGAELEQLLLDLGPEVDARCDRVREARLDFELVHVRLGGVHEPAVGGEAVFALLVGGLVVLVGDLVHLARHEGPTLRELDELEPLAALHDDVQATVVEAFEDGDDRSARPDLAHPGLVGEHETEVGVLVDALSDQLLVAGLEDMERHPLARQEHELEREQADLVHARSVGGRAGERGSRRDPVRISSGFAIHACAFVRYADREGYLRGVPRGQLARVMGRRTKVRRMGDDYLFRPAISELVPYEPGKPVEEVQRELGLARVVKLASNEGQFGPFPAALEVIERGARELNRYPDGGAYRLTVALADKHGVEAENVALAAGADGVIMYLSLAALDPGDEIVCGWPSFPSYVLAAIKMGATPVRVPLADDRYDLEALRKAVTPRTKLVYIPNPNNPTGTMVGRAELDAYFARVPEHVLTVLDEAYFEYVDEPEYGDGIEEYLKRDGRRVLVLRTFSKIYGLAGLRVGYGIGPADVVQAIRKVRNAFDVNQTAQDAALASLGDEAEIALRRAATARSRAALEAVCGELPVRVATPAVANFLFVDVGEDATAVFQALLREGVIVRPLAAFGAPSAIRVTVGTPEENRLFGEAFARSRPLSVSQVR